MLLLPSTTDRSGQDITVSVTRSAVVDCMLMQVAPENEMFSSTNVATLTTGRRRHQVTYDAGRS